MYVEDPLLPLHLNEETDLIDLTGDLTVSKHGNQKLLCVVSLSALFVLLLLWKKPFVPHSPTPAEEILEGRRMMPKREAGSNCELACISFVCIFCVYLEDPLLFIM